MLRSKVTPWAEMFWLEGSGRGRGMGLGAVVVGLWLGFSSVARAGDMAAAEALFRQGRALFERGEIASACDKFAESQRLDPSSGTLINLAACHEKQGKIASAWAEFLAAGRMAHLQGHAERAAEARRRAAKLEPRLCTLSISVTQKVPGLALFRDDVRIDDAALQSPIPIDPGTHVIRATAPGHEPWTEQIEAGLEKRTTTVTVPVLTPSSAVETLQPGEAARVGEPAKLAPARPPPKSPASSLAVDANESSSTLAYVIGGAGVVATGVGATFGILAMSKYNRAEELCPTHLGCNSAAMDKRNVAGTYATVANVATGVGLIGVGAGVVLLVAGHSSGPEQSHSVAIVPGAGPRGAGATLSGRF